MSDTDPPLVMLDGEVMPAPPGLAAALLIAPVTAPVPQSVTNLQARTALRMAGLFDAAEAAIRGHGATLPGVEGAILLDAWERGAFERNSPSIALMAGLLSLSDDQVDELFRAAAAVTL